MGKRKIGIHIAVGICAAIGWWGIFYPELTMLPDTYTIISEETQETTENATICEENLEEWAFDNTIYQEILRADKSQVKLQSKLFQKIQKLLESY